MIFMRSLILLGQGWRCVMSLLQPEFSSKWCYLLIFNLVSGLSLGSRHLFVMIFLIKRLIMLPSGWVFERLVNLLRLQNKIIVISLRLLFWIKWLNGSKLSLIDIWLVLSVGNVNYFVLTLFEGHNIRVILSRIQYYVVPRLIYVFVVIVMLLLIISIGLLS
jgi:hypothetical protein